jgi:hypothetical protein
MTTRGLLLLGPFIGLAVFGAANFSSCAGSENDPTVDEPGSSDVASLTLPTSVPLSVTSITSPLVPDSTGRLDALTTEGATCELINGSASADSDSTLDLGSKVADATGFVSWSWVISSDTPPGVEQLRLTCNGETVTAQVEIAAPETPGPDAGGSD